MSNFSSTESILCTMPSKVINFISTLMLPFNPSLRKISHLSVPRELDGADMSAPVGVKQGVDAPVADPIPELDGAIFTTRGIQVGKRAVLHL